MTDPKCDPCNCPEYFFRDPIAWNKAMLNMLCRVEYAVQHITMGAITIGAVDIQSFPAGNLGQHAMAASLSIVPANNITDATYIGDIKFGESLPAGTNNIGDVDIASFPAGNLGQQAMVASLSIVPASDITDATYIGDIKFGESLPAGANNIGDVDINSFPAGNLGMQAMNASLSIVPANNITDATYIGDIKFGESLPAGTNNIGDVDLISLPAGNLGQQAMAASLSIVPASNITDATYIGDIKFGEELPAGTQLVGKISAGGDTSTVYNGVTALTPKWAFANVAASQTDSSVVAAVGGKKIRVLSAAVVAGGTATNITFNSKGGGAGTAISALFANGANGGEVLPYSPVGWFETAGSEALTVTTGAGSTTGIHVCYVEV